MIFFFTNYEILFFKMQHKPEKQQKYRNKSSKTDSNDC